MERELRGQKGQRDTIVDVSYEEIAVLKELSPTAGNNIRLTLDLRLQMIMSDALAYGLRESNSPRGAAIALNPNTGEVLGMVGFPTYDNNWFARGITPEELNVLSENIHSPYVNHATQDQVPPGSTFKIVTTAAILEESSRDNVNAFTRIYDPGIFELPSVFEGQPGQKFYCWIGLRGGRHEYQTAQEALRNSCDTYYYKAVGGFEEEGIQGIGSDALGDWAEAFGIGQEYDSLGVPYSVGFPASQLRIQRRAGGVWTQGDSYNASIGQGKILATPLEMANVTAVIANGGTLYSPQVVRDVINPQNQIVQPYQPQVIRQVPMSAENLELIRRGMWEVVNLEGGTANYSASLQKWGIEYAGKTGTAEFCDDIAQKARLCPPYREFLPTHAWFVAYAPYENPQIAIAVYVWNGGQGSGVTAPIAARIIAKYFNLPVPEEELPKVVKAQSE
jgi:penicillin-binding protein 2